MNNLMVNLTNESLKQSLKNEIIFALNRIKNPCANITITFTDKKGIICKEKIELILGSLRYKKVDLTSLGKEKAVELIVENIHVNYFNYVETKIKEGKVQCHGLGDYWGTDTIIIHYHRYN